MSSPTGSRSPGPTAGGGEAAGLAGLAGLLEELGGPPARGGVVHIVGGGPGDPGCLSLRGARLLATCDVVAHDHLSPTEALDLVPDGADRILVGRRRGRPGYEREELDDLLLARAAAGDAVVRLKGGDPFVFGRGGEEAQACVDAGLPFEVVPGVTSPVAVPGAAGIPVTHRGVARGVAVITGHEPLATDDEAAGAVAAFPGTLVVLMGLAGLRTLAERLIAHGRSPDTPAAVVASGTLPAQRSVRATLATLADAAEEQELTTPAVVVVGEVVGLLPTLPGREQRELHGRRVLLPRSSRGPSRLAAALRHAGAEVLTLPVAREVEGDPAAVARVAADVVAGRVGRLVVGDARGLERVADALLELGADLRSLARVEVWAVGERVASRLSARLGLRPDRVLDDAAPWPPHDREGTTVALVADHGEPGGSTAPADGARGVRTVVTSRLEPLPAGGAPEADVAVVPASRLVAPLLPWLAGRDLPLVALGPATGAALARHGRRAAATAAGPTPEALVAAVRDLGS